MDYAEKRACARCYYEAPVTCAYFNSDKFYRLILEVKWNFKAIEVLICIYI
jgi:hypothetical protein